MFVAIAEFLFSPFFIGFTIWSFVYVFTKRDSLAGYTIEKIDFVAARAVIFMGLVHVGITFFVNGLDTERAFGEYWFGFWIYPITYAGLTQLLWFRAVRKNKITRLILAGWFFIVIHLEKFVIIITSIHRDFVTDDETSLHFLGLLGYLVLNVIIASAIFAILIFSILRFIAWFRRQRN